VPLRAIQVSSCFLKPLLRSGATVQTGTNIRSIGSESRRRTLAADEESREYHEEQRDEFENFVEEERSEQDERSREQVEQWREYHYDGLYPPYLYNRHIV
uniref:Unique cartilage matrix-associated protein n=1 Tax=Salvator merianae TaxID=96440 RepID=A0A8D0C416_SALMN